MKFFITEARLRSSCGKVVISLLGKKADGESAVAQIVSIKGLTLRFVLPDGVTADLAYKELMDRHLAKGGEEAFVGMPEGDKQKKLRRLKESIRHSKEERPLFYGFVPSATNVLEPAKRHILVLTFHNVSWYKKFRRIAEDVLHDAPLPCGATPCELHQPAHTIVMESEFSIRQGQWVRLTVGDKHPDWWVSTSDVSGAMHEYYCTGVRHLECTDAPQLTVSSFDIETSTTIPRADGSFSIACNPSVPSHEVVSVALVTVVLDNATNAVSWRRAFFVSSKRACEKSLGTKICDEIVAQEGEAFAKGDTVKHESEASPPTVVVVGGEFDLLRRVAEYIRGLHVDIMVGYNSSGFDFPYLASRMRRLDPRSFTCGLERGKLEPMWAWGRFPTSCRPPHRKGAPPSPEEIRNVERAKAAGRVIFEPTTFDSPGCGQLDCLDYAKTLNLESSKLSEVATHLFGADDTKLDLPYDEMMRMVYMGDAASLATVGCYNLRDALLPIRILLAKRQIGFALQLHRVTGCSLPEIVGGGQGKRLVSMVSREVRRRNLIFNEPSKLDFCDLPWLSGGGAKVRGAVVLDVAAGYYRDPICTCDYASLYPSIIISRNLCPSTLLLRQSDGSPVDATRPTLPESTPAELVENCRIFDIDERDDDGDGIVLHHYHAVLQVGAAKERFGVFPCVAEQLLTQRKASKTEMKNHKVGSSEYVRLDAQQNALKVAKNTPSEANLVPSPQAAHPVNSLTGAGTLQFALWGAERHPERIPLLSAVGRHRHRVWALGHLRHPGRGGGASQRLGGGRRHRFGHVQTRRPNARGGGQGGRARRRRRHQDAATRRRSSHDAEL